MDLLTRFPVIVERCGVEVLGDDLLAARESVAATHAVIIVEAACIGRSFRSHCSRVIHPSGAGSR